MRIGFIGLGRMGANMVRRLLRDGHEIVAYNRTPEKTREIEGEGALAAFTIAELVEKLEKPRAVWVMVPAGDATEAQIRELLEHLERATRSSTAATPSTTTSAATGAQRHGINYVDAGTSGDLGPSGGLLPDGRRRQAAVDPLVPVFATLAPRAATCVGGRARGTT
jgi:6-phosphogluconate dehydrogenase